MSNWDLMMPGMGLTAIGVAGVTISYAGIAHTFIDGMHALTGLTMFIGLIFLAAGILDGGVSTSNRAKATTLVILGISLSFAVSALVFNSITSVPTFAGVMLIVAIPAIVLAYVSMKMPDYAKPIGIIFIFATGAAIAAYVGFGLYGPSQYLVPPPEVEEERIVTPSAPITSISILKGSAVNGAPDYDPDVAQVPAGNNIEWTNYDDVAHTVTSASDAGSTFDSSLINAGEKYLLDTSKLQPGTYEYICIVHPWMTASFVYGGEAPIVPEVAISILPDSAIQGNPDYEPDSLQVVKGHTIVWTNNDSMMHTATSTGVFDSDILNAGDVYKLDTSSLELGKHDYICIIHPWMTGSFDLVDATTQRLAEGATATDPNSIPQVVEEAPVVETPTEETQVEVPITEVPIEDTPVEEIPLETPTEEMAPTADLPIPSELVIVEMAEGTASNQDCADQCFVPSIAYVTVGGTVTWKNVDSAAHTATESAGIFDSSIVMAGGEFSHTFADAGEFDYICIVHPWMKGKVIVG